MACLIIPERIKIVISVDSGLLALLEKLAEDKDTAPKLQALVDRLTMANRQLSSMVAAHPDPDPKD